MRKKESIDRNREIEERLPHLKCECGVKILLLPDLKIMNHAIEVHIADHLRKEKNRSKKNATANRVRGILIEQLLRKSSE